MKNPLSFGALIPDKNRTWAKNHFKMKHLTPEQLEEGYLRGGDVCKQVISVARDEMMKIIALWGMSDDNMVNRPEHERKVLYAVFQHFLKDLQDTWMDKEENKDVRFIHLGRRDRLAEEAPALIKQIDSITDHTRGRTGMAMAVGLDYGGLEEQRRAMKLWADAGRPGDPVDGWRPYLDLPRQGVIDIPVNLIVRTGHTAGKPGRDNEFLHAYRQETRVMPSHLYLPDYSGDLFRYHIGVYHEENQNRGK